MHAFVALGRLFMVVFIGVALSCGPLWGGHPWSFLFVFIPFMRAAPGWLFVVLFMGVALSCEPLWVNLLQKVSPLVEVSKGYLWVLLFL